MLKKMIRFLQNNQPKVQRHPEQGFSLLEALVGILVITLVVSAITPPIILTMATQVQNRRAEQALQLAQGEVDRVRTLVAQSNYVNTDLPTVPATFGTAGDITSAPPPTSLSATIKSSSNQASCTALYNGNTVVPADTALQVDVDGNCNQPTFLVQTFRDNGVTAAFNPNGTNNNNTQTVLFHLGVRVYSAQAISSSGTLNLANPVSCASLQSTSGLGSQQVRPLAVMYTTISRGDSTFLSLQRYQNFLQQTAVNSTTTICR